MLNSESLRSRADYLFTSLRESPNHVLVPESSTSRSRSTMAESFEPFATLANMLPRFRSRAVWSDAR
jgi:hypothetical protein